jgi:hypothetical protein
MGSWRSAWNKSGASEGDDIFSSPESGVRLFERLRSQDVQVQVMIGLYKDGAQCSNFDVSNIP